MIVGEASRTSGSHKGQSAGLPALATEQKYAKVREQRRDKLYPKLAIGSSRAYLVVLDWDQ